MKTKRNLISLISLLASLTTILCVFYFHQQKKTEDQRNENNSIRNLYVANLSSNWRISSSYLTKILNNNLNSKYFVKEIKSRKISDAITEPKNGTFLFYVSENFSYDKLDVICDKLGDCSYTFVLNAVNKKNSTKKEYFMNRDNFEMFFSNNERIIVSNFDPKDGLCSSATKGLFMKTIFDKLSEHTSYSDLVTFFKAVNQIDSSHVFFTTRDDGAYKTKTLHEVDVLRDIAIEQLSKKLEEVLKSSNENERESLIQNLESIYGDDLIVEYNEDIGYPHQEYLPVRSFVNYYFKKLIPYNEKAFTNPIPENDECKYNITQNKLEKFVIQEGVLNSQWSN